MLIKYASTQRFSVLLLQKQLIQAVLVGFYCVLLSLVSLNIQAASIVLTPIGGAAVPSTSPAASAEIIAFQAQDQRLLVANSKPAQLEVFRLTPQGVLSHEGWLAVGQSVAEQVEEIGMNDVGDLTSVAVRDQDGLVAVTVALKTGQPGYVVFYTGKTLALVGLVRVGHLPDMLTFSPDGTHLLVANEGEPTADYSYDPPGSVTVLAIEKVIEPGLSVLRSATELQFDEVPGLAAIRTRHAAAGDAAQQARDVEPEYIAVSADSATAYIALQENNAIATLNLRGADGSPQIERLWSLGRKDHRLPANAIDASDRDGGIKLRNWPLYSYFMPDGLAAYTVAGETYLLTANEGDAREYAGYRDTRRVAELRCRLQLSKADQDWLATHHQRERRQLTYLRGDAALGRLWVEAESDHSKVCAPLTALGARSVSIWHAGSGELVWDSGADFERISHQALGEDANQGDSRSDVRGPEPEALAVFTIADETYAFIGLEKTNGVMVYRITNPQQPEFIQYVVADPKRYDGPESLLVVSAEAYGGTQPLLLVAHEYSASIAVFRIDMLP